MRIAEWIWNTNIEFWHRRQAKHLYILSVCHAKYFSRIGFFFHLLCVLFKFCFMNIKPPPYMTMVQRMLSAWNWNWNKRMLLQQICVLCFWKDSFESELFTIEAFFAFYFAQKCGMWKSSVSHQQRFWQLFLFSIEFNPHEQHSH